MVGRARTCSVWLRIDTEQREIWWTSAFEHLNCLSCDARRQGRSLSLSICSRRRAMEGNSGPETTNRGASNDGLQQGVSQGVSHFVCGDDGTRTHDPLLAKQVLCQLSYVPEKSRP
jgi:hypothetical protein